MKTNPTQAADLLDVIFADRNKAYGAYVLRRGYDRRVQWGLLSSLLLAGLFSLAIRWKSDPAQLMPHFTVHDPVTLIDPFIPPPPEMPEPPAAAASPATVQDLVPVVVPDETRIDHPVPTVDELAEAAPGVQDRAGEGTATAATGFGSGTAALPVEPVPQAVEEQQVYDFRAVEIPAAFPGGDKALRRFLERNLRTPESGQQGDQSTVRVMVKFIVSTEGKIGGVELLHSGGNLFDEEVKRVLGRMPQWTPARQNGRNVPMYFLLPVVFSLETED